MEEKNVFEQKWEVVENESCVAKLRRKASEKIHGVKQWLEDHGEQTYLWGSAALGAVGVVCYVAQTIRGGEQARHDRKVAKQYYDPSTGFHWDLKRKPKNSDRIELSKRKKNGESTEDILEDLDLI